VNRGRKRTTMISFSAATKIARVDARREIGVDDVIGVGYCFKACLLLQPIADRHSHQDK